MKISKGNVQIVNRRILAGTLACTFLATKLIGYQVVRKIKYSHVKAGYVQTEDTCIKFKEDYAILPKKSEMNFNDLLVEPNNPKDNYKKNKVNGLIVRGKRKVLRKVIK
ncbi:MAG: hypothetical protein IKL65_00650 [Bacilli bacterium]|nr:hypothetical protein [Bacilli bacterium]